jgi:hypothetical protein
MNREDFMFYRVRIPCRNIHADTISIANDHRYEVLGDASVVYNAKIYDNIWHVGVYYPYSFKGTYQFELSEQENQLFQSLIAPCNKLSAHIFPIKKIIDSLNQEAYGRNMEFYLNIQQKDSASCIFYGILPCVSYVPREIDRIYQFAAIIIRNHVHSVPYPDTSFIGILDVREQFNQYARNTGWTGLLVEDIDTSFLKLMEFMSEKERKKIKGSYSSLYLKDWVKKIQKNKKVKK